MKITYLTKKERKTIQIGDFRSILTLNHLSLIDKEEEKWWQLGLKIISWYKHENVLYIVNQLKTLKWNKLKTLKSNQQCIWIE